MYNLSKELRLTVDFPVKINEDVYLHDAMFVKSEKFQGISFIFRKDDEESGQLQELKYMLYDVNPKSIPSWTTLEKEIHTLKSRVYHILENFYDPEDIKIDADNFEDMASKVIFLLKDGPIKDRTTFSLKLIYNKSFEKIILPARGHVIKSDKVNYELSYTDWEKENYLLPEELDDDDTSFGGDVI
jgi:hypothetical protein